MRATFRLSLMQEALLEAAGERVFASMPRDGVVPHPNAVDAAWADLGRSMGFDPDTVEFVIPTRTGEMYGEAFTAEVV